VKKVSMREAKTHLSRLVKEEFAITVNGRPVAHVQPLGGAAAGRVGFLPEALAKETLVPDDFNSMGARQIAELFGANR
jgi:antitoxin (DNA-binding transcriptional repressor) of toxin-antitoxin stability system